MGDSLNTGMECCCDECAAAFVLTRFQYNHRRENDKVVLCDRCDERLYDAVIASGGWRDYCELDNRGTMYEHPDSREVRTGPKPPTDALTIGFCASGNKWAESWVDRKTANSIFTAAEIAAIDTALKSHSASAPAWDVLVDAARIVAAQKFAP